MCQNNQNNINTKHKQTVKESEGVERRREESEEVEKNGKENGMRKKEDFFKI